MVKYEGYEITKIEKFVDKKIAIVTMNDPDHRNPVSDKSQSELADMFEAIDVDDDINCVVLTGAGKCFCAGGDIREFSKLLTHEQTHYRLEDVGSNRNLRAHHGILDCRVPVIAAVQGDAIGAGANIAMSCDIVIMAEDARIADWHVKMGLVPGDGGVMWSLHLPFNRAKELMITGDTLNGIEAERWGLVNHVYPREEVLPKAIELAERLARGPIQAISWTKTCMNRFAHQYINSVIEVAIAREMILFMNSPDHQEAVKAFWEKRDPVFKGGWISKGIAHRKRLPY
jgi:enoyl-CoA hydratase/carnithine racemase